jgi:hypothetical protein
MAMQMARLLVVLFLGPAIARFVATHSGPHVAAASPEQPTLGEPEGLEDPCESG